MRLSNLKNLVGLALLSASFAIPAISQKTAAPMDRAPAPIERVDLSEVSRGSQDVSRFLAQPKLGEALAKAKSDKSAGGEISQNANAYLAKQGVQVPGNMKVQIKPPAGGGGASKIKVDVHIHCCPLTIVIIISW